MLPVWKRAASSEQGFTLIEVLVAGLLLCIGLMALAYGFGVGLSVVMTAQEDTIARQKAREALESVLTGRNTENLTFQQICNQSVSNPQCVFVNGLTPLTTPGADGMVNTVDDGPVETIVLPGPDGQLGTFDDTSVPLSGYRRQVQITQLSPILKQITVSIQYRTPPGLSRSVTVVTYVSPYI